MTQRLSDKKISRKPDWLNKNVISTVLIIKILILFFAAQSYQAVTDQPIKEVDWFFGLLRHWDAESYLKIAEFGYNSTGNDKFRLVFFPLYPALVALFRIVFRNYVLSALIVSGVATVALGLVFRRLVKLDYSEKTAQIAVLFLFIFPTSHFLHLPYSESLFLALTVGCFLAARQRVWFAAGILGALACLTRINGLVLIFALAFEVWEEYRETRRINRKWFFLVLLPAGFAGYLWINYFVAGNPFQFLVYQRENFGRRFDFPWNGIKGAFDRLDSPKPTDLQMTGVQELMFVAIGLLATVFGWRHLRNSYRVWMILNWLLFVCTTNLLSVPRYTLIMFPIFILMAQIARQNRQLKVLFIVWSILYLALFLMQFARAWWAF